MSEMVQVEPGIWLRKGGESRRAKERKAEKRMIEIEKRLDEVASELRELRRQLEVRGDVKDE